MPKRPAKKGAKKKRHQNLPVELTDDEVANRSQQLVVLLNEIDEKKEGLKSFVKVTRGEIEDMRVDSLILREAVSEKLEAREVEVQHELRAGTVYITRLDTGEVVDQRAANDEDRQQGLFEGE